MHLPHKDSASATSEPSGSVPSEQHGPTRYVSENVPAEGNLAAQDLEPKNGTKTGRFNKGGGEVLFRRKWSWGCGRVFEKKNVFLFVSSIQMVFVKFPDVFLLYMLVNFSTGSSGKLSRIFAFFCSICPDCGCCGFIWNMWVMLGKYPKNWYHHGVYTYRVYAGIVKTNC